LSTLPTLKAIIGQVYDVMLMPQILCEGLRNPIIILNQ
jgi:hypothetical protein